LATSRARPGRRTSIACSRLLARHAGRALAVYHWPDSVDGEGLIRRTLAHPLYIARPTASYMRHASPPVAASAPSRGSQAKYVRSGALTLEQAVRKITGFPAERFSLRDRGLLVAGRAADVTVFDPDGLADLSAWHNGRVSPSGIAYVIVNGEVVVTTESPRQPAGKDS